MEVSGKESLVFNGNVDLSAANGDFGTLLLDPENIIISDAPSNPADVEDSLPDIFGDEFEDEEITINADTLTSLTGDIILEATNDITIADGISLTFANPEDSDNPGGSIVFRADSDLDNEGIFSMDSTQTLATQGRTISIFAESIDIGSIDTSVEDTLESGSITLEVTGDITTGRLISQEGDIGIFTSGVVQVNDIQTSGSDVNIGRENLIADSVNIINSISTYFFDPSTETELIGSVDVFSQKGIRALAIFGENITLSVEDNLTSNENFNVNFVMLPEENGEINLKTKGNLLLNELEFCELSCTFDSRGSLNLKSQENITLANGNIDLLGTLNIQAEDTVTILDSPESSLKLNIAGDINIRGESGIAINSLNHPNSLIESANTITLESNGNILGDARFLAQDIFCLAASCEFASISSEGIISAQGDLEFEDYTGPALKVEAQGNITGGNITITEPNDSLSGTDPDIPLLASTPSVILRAGVAQLQNDPTVSPGNDLEIEETTFSSTELPSSPGNINVGNIDTYNYSEVEGGNDNGSVILEATGSIQTGSIQTGGSEDQARHDLGFVSLLAGDDITVDWIDTQGSGGGDISIATMGLFRAINSIPFTETDFHTGSQIEGEQIAQIDEIPTSLNASGREGGTISIQHGGSTFGIGPELTVKDADGNLVFLEIAVGDGEVFVRNAVDESGNPVTLTDLDDNPIDLSDPDTYISIDQINLTVEHSPLTLADVPETASFTAGAITSNSDNSGPIHSFRDAFLTCMGTPPCNTSVGMGSAEIEIDSLSALEAQMPSPQPIPEPTPQPMPEPEIVPQPTPEPAPQPIPEPEIAPQPTPEPEIAPQPIPEPAPQPIPEPAPQPIPEPAPQPIPEPAPQPIPEPQIAPQPIPEPAPQPTPEPEIAPQPIPEPAPESNPESNDVDVAARVIENNENRSPQSEQSPQSACTCPNDRTETSETDDDCNDRTKIPQNCRSQLLEIEPLPIPNSAPEIRRENGAIQIRGSGVPATEE